MTTWGVAEAKAKFSSVLDKVESEGPQLVRRRRRDFYVLTKEQLDACTQADALEAQRTGSLVEFFRNSPLRGSGIELERVKLEPRHVEF